MKWNGGGKRAVWASPRSRDGLHVAQKPLGLLKELISLFCDDGALIVDPFMGSGTTLRAAMDLGCRAIGIKLEERYCEIAARRLSQQCFTWWLGARANNRFGLGNLVAFAPKMLLQSLQNFRDPSIKK